MSEEKPDSIKHHEERTANMRAEHDTEQYDRIAAEEHENEVRLKQEQAAREDEERVLNQYAALVSHTDTRDMILERIRRMRKDKPPEIKPMGRTPEQQKQLEAEQAAGRAAVAKAEAQEARNREIREKAKAEDAARQGHMTPVYHPNPGQNQQFPANKATLGKTK